MTEQEHQPITIVVPCGPFEDNIQWLRECIDSIATQTLIPYEIILIDDGAQLEKIDWLETVDGVYKHSRKSSYILDNKGIDIVIYKMFWRTGIPSAFNIGVSLSETELVLMLGSDDTLEPDCLEECHNAYLLNHEKPGYYTMPVKYMDTGEIQTAPCNAAMVTKHWFLNEIGGFPIETAVGACDNIFLSICLKHALPIHFVSHLLGQEGEAIQSLYNVRRHKDMHTYKLGKFWGVIDELRNILTRDWSREDIKLWSNKYGL